MKRSTAQRLLRNQHLVWTTPRTEEKRLARQADADALASGETTVEQLRKDNAAFTFPEANVLLAEAERLS